MVPALQVLEPLATKPGPKWLLLRTKPFNFRIMKSQFLLFLSFSICSNLGAQVSFTQEATLIPPFGAFGPECGVDMNSDFLDDVVRVSSTTISIDYQQEDGTFLNVQYPVNFQNTPDWSICAGDIDGNGFNDLLFGGGGGVSFIYANEDGTHYTAVDAPDFIFSQRSNFVDIDNDGNLDAFVCNDIAQNHPYRNDGSGNLFLDQSLIPTMNAPGNYSAIWVDYDNDADPDLYITKCELGAQPGDPNRTNLLYRNDGDGAWPEVAAEAGLDDNAQSWSTSFEDFDNDGDFDAFIVNHDFKNRFLLNNGDGTFTDTIESTGIDPNDLGAWENASGDFNNDGFVDILSQLEDELYLNNGDGTFTAIQLPFSDGGIADFNNDGFLDVTQGGNIWRNDGNENNWVKINTVGSMSNKNGIGARVEIYGDWGRQIREVRAGQSFSPMSSLTVHFGLGQANSIDSIIVKWPSGMISKLDNPPINTTFIIEEDNCILNPTTLLVNGDTNLCKGESVEISAPDGYSYQWSTGDTTQSISVFEPGAFSAILTDTSGCLSFSNSVVINFTEEIVPAVGVEGNLVLCKGDSVRLTSVNGENPTWSNGIIGPAIEVSESGEYFVSVDGVCTTEQIKSEPVTVTVLDVAEPSVENIVIGEGNTALLSATGENLEWYDTETGGTALGTGPTFETPPLSESATFYVEAHHFSQEEIQIGGEVESENAFEQMDLQGYLIFNSFEPFTLLTTEVVTTTAGMRTIQLVDENNQVLSEILIFIPAGFTEIELNFEVPPGNGLSLRCLENNLGLRNTNLDYPYAIGDVGTITTSSAGQDFYFYFFNWKVQKPGIECVSKRVPVSVVVTGIEEMEAFSQLKIYPNPADDNLKIEMDATEGGEAKLALFNVLGKTVLQQNLPIHLGKNIQTLHFENEAAGVYYLQLKMNGRQGSWKVVLQ